MKPFWTHKTFHEPLQSVPRDLLPYYLDWIVSTCYSWISSTLQKSLSDHNPMRSVDDPFVSLLLLATLQFFHYVPSAPLNWETNEPSLAAGLPFFSTGFMRNWGRDTLISLKGCLLVPERYTQARNVLVTYGRVMRHGLIPNLLDSGRNPRYNARDVPWFFLNAVREYCELSPEGLDFLKTDIRLRFPDNALGLSPAVASVSIRTIADLIHVILSAHSTGIDFVERNAGPQLDSHMTTEGFHIQIRFDSDTGVFYGGNQWNCGTWMDKMGSSEKANNKGIPATPRDGAAVELLGLLKSTLRFVNRLPQSLFPCSRPETRSFTYRDWEKALNNAFDPLFYIGPEDEDRPGLTDVNRHFVNHVGIYRDTLHATKEWGDYQLRPNYCITLALAPEMCSIAHARRSLESAAVHLMNVKHPTKLQTTLNFFKNQVGPDGQEVVRALRLAHLSNLYTSQLGMKTLDSSDLTFRPDYNNHEDSHDPHTSQGFNYHNGPEWVWPLGFFLEALLGLDQPKELNRSNSKSYDAHGRLKVEHPSPSRHEYACARFNTMRYLLPHRRHIAIDPWLSLPEVTNADGRFTPNGCPSQAWSISTILSFLRTVIVSHGYFRPDSRPHPEKNNSVLT